MGGASHRLHRSSDWLRNQDYVVLWRGCHLKLRIHFVNFTGVDLRNSKFLAGSRGL